VIERIFKLFWRKRLQGLKLVAVKGWNRCLVDDRFGQRVHVQFLFGFPTVIEEHFRKLRAFEKIRTISHANDTSTRVNLGTGSDTTETP